MMGEGRGAEGRFEEGDGQSVHGTPMGSGRTGLLAWTLPPLKEERSMTLATDGQGRPELWVQGPWRG